MRAVGSGGLHFCPALDLRSVSTRRGPVSSRKRTLGKCLMNSGQKEPGSISLLPFPAVHLVRATPWSFQPSVSLAYALKKKPLLLRLFQE